MDKVRITWRHVPSFQYSDGDVEPEYWQAQVNGALLFNDSNHDEFFRRYTAVTIEKEAAPVIVSDDICGICGQPGADKMALWTGGGVYWPGEFRPDTELVHQYCEQAETARAHAALTQEQRDAVLRSIRGG